jgi:hypothetical protein
MVVVRHYHSVDTLAPLSIVWYAVGTSLRTPEQTNYAIERRPIFERILDEESRAFVMSPSPFLYAVVPACT